MKLGVYDLINNPLPQLYMIKEIEVDKNEFKYDESIVGIMNKYFKMDKLTSEHIYVIGLTYSLYPKGIIQLNIGNDDSCSVDLRKLATGLLLIGAEQFICFHNHPGYERKISEADIKLTEKYKELENVIGIHFIKHLMITKDYYTECINKKENETVVLFGQEVTL